jgi:hypothetical protein
MRCRKKKVNTGKKTKNDGIIMAYGCKWHVNKLQFTSIVALGGIS